MSNPPPASFFTATLPAAHPASHCATNLGDPPKQNSPALLNYSPFRTFLELHSARLMKLIFLGRELIRETVIVVHGTWATPQPGKSSWYDPFTTVPAPGG